VPFLIFTPRRWRMAGAFVLLGLQTLIFLTGNYTFFNLLTMALTLFLFDDQALSWMVKPKIATRPSTKRARMGMALLAVTILALGIGRLAGTIAGAIPEPLETLTRVLSPFQVVNSYGLFAVMTTTRPEIIVEGSDDGENWRPYEFRYKPGNLYRAPRWIQPFQPRLDWQMWFAALGTYESNPWFPELMLRLLEGSPGVLGLLENNPFPGHPPRLVRAELFEYSFTDRETHARTGAWWKREPLGIYLPPVGMRAAPESPSESPN
jgi:lipase maturation factor 1